MMLKVLLLSSAVATAIYACSERPTQRLDFDVSKDVIPNKALKGHVISTLNVSNVPDCQRQCILNSDCLSTNYRASETGGYCELNDADDVLDQAAIEYSPGAMFYRLKLRNVCRKEGTFDFHKDQCPESSCLRSKCPSHTTCREMCHPKFKRYICQCPSYSKSNCEDLPRTCDDIRKSLGYAPTINGIYYVFNSTDSLSQVYCDFTSEKNYTYTLIESYSFANNGVFKRLGFYADVAFGENEFTWEKYRLSKARMEYLALKSSHVRGTCNMDTTLSTRDYLRIKLSEIPLFVQFKARCTKHEHVSILGKSCFDCSTGVWQVANEHLHLNPGVDVSCDFGPSSGFAFTQTFGLYNTYDKTHDCARSLSSTSQFWLGTKY